MRYNPSQATRLLLDPLISVSSAKMMTDVGGLCIQAPEIPLPAPERFTGHVLSLSVSGSPHFFRKTIFCHPPASPQSSQTVSLS
jgi:hypothetical protein